jgi:hypothetical protein
MHGVNLDLLKTTHYRADGAPRDPYARHRAEHLTTLRAARHAWLRAALGRILAVVALPWRSSMASPLLIDLPREEDEVARGAAR